MFYFLSPDTGITIYFADGSSAVWKISDPEFRLVSQLAQNADWLTISVLHNQAKSLLRNDVEVLEDKVVIYDNQSNTSTSIDLNTSNSRLLRFIKLLKQKGVIDEEITRIKPFLENMFMNPYINAVHEIYDFCTKMDFEITDDGCFLAYKNVREDLGSIYDGGQTKHVIGEYTEVEAFDTDRNQTCSKGLHFCSSNYLTSYPGQVTLIVKVNPKDVVAIPTDYNFEKGRCRRYMPVGIIAKGEKLQSADIRSLTKGAVNVIRSYPNRIKETAELMKQHNYDTEKVAKIMGIKTSTVERNMRKYRKHRRRN